jgi:predicted permease
MRIERWLHTLPLRFRSLFRRKDVEQELDDEIRDHIERQTAANVADGMSASAARTAALSEFGGIERRKEEVRETRGVSLFEHVVQDLNYALRGLRRSPGFAAAVVVTLALGIGANATLFGVIDRLLLRPPDYVREPDRVVRFYTFGKSSFRKEWFSNSLGDYAGFAAIRDRATSFEHVAGFLTRKVTLGRGAEAAQLQGTLVSANFFPLLGVRPVLGRFFADDEDRETASPTLVLSEEVWRTRFGGDSTVLGRLVKVQGTQYAVVGVAPRGFTGTELTRTDLWLPMHVAARDVLRGSQWQEEGGYWMEFVARLKPGATNARANAEASALLRQSRGAHLDIGDSLRVEVGSVIRARGPNPEPEVRTAKWLAAMSLVVLLIACANVANLLLARAVERRREIAVRVALGIGRGRLVAQLLGEGVLLAALGGLAALVVAYWSSVALRSFLLPNIVWTGWPVDTRTLGITASAALLTGLLTGLVPALQASHPDLVAGLKAGERSSGSRTHKTTRVSLLVAQAALSVVLLIGAGLFVRSLHNVQSLDLGVRADSVMIVSVDLKGIGYTRPQVAAFFEQAAERVQGLPIAERVSLASAYSFGGSVGSGVTIPGHDSLPALPSGGPYEFDVSPGYFSTLGTRVLRGREFSAVDGARGEPVVIVNQTMADLYWPGHDPVGACVKIDGHGDACARIVGVVANARRYSLNEERQLMFYAPLAQSDSTFAGSWRALLFRPRGDPLAAARAVREALQSLAANLPYVSVTPMSEALSPQVRPWRLGAVLFSVFGILALAVAALGLFSVVSFGVEQRRGELGIRMALGAEQGDVLRLVLREGALYAICGVAVGSLVSFALSPLAIPLLFGVSPRDPTVYGAVAGMLLLVALVASALPALRTTHVDPASVLRAE